jgi:hypothetical protein
MRTLSNGSATNWTLILQGLKEVEENGGNKVGEKAKEGSR